MPVFNSPAWLPVLSIGFNNKIDDYYYSVSFHFIIPGSFLGLELRSLC